VHVTARQHERQQIAFAETLGLRRPTDDQWEDVEQGTNEQPDEHRTYGDVPDGLGQASLPDYDSLEPFQKMYQQMETRYTSKPLKEKAAQVNQRNRKGYAQNWQSVFPALVEAHITGKQQCSPVSCVKCAERGPKVLSMWFIGFSCFERRTVEMCRCTKAQALISQGFFPASPVRPVFAFSMQMLDIFDRILGRGPISKQAFVEGLGSY
jgi:hypothetical protein